MPYRIAHHMAALDGWPHPPNSLEAIDACLQAGARVIEIDATALASGDYLLVHDELLEHETTGSGRVEACTPEAARALHIRFRGQPMPQRAALLGDVVALLQRHGGSVLLQVDLKSVIPMPTDEPLQRLARLLAPLGRRAIVSSGADWQLRRLSALAPALRTGFDIMWHLAWSDAPEQRREPPYTMGAYGYLDESLQSKRKIWPLPQYLDDRCQVLHGLVPRADTWYVHHVMIRRMLDDGFNLAQWLHTRGLQLDAWTMDIGNPRAEANLIALRDAGVDLFKTNTPAALARALA